MLEGHFGGWAAVRRLSLVVVGVVIVSVVLSWDRVLLAGGRFGDPTFGLWFYPPKSLVLKGDGGGQVERAR